jgi:hypothetical protein
MLTERFIPSAALSQDDKCRQLQLLGADTAVIGLLIAAASTVLARILSYLEGGIAGTLSAALQVIQFIGIIALVLGVAFFLLSEDITGKRPHVH